MQHLKYVYWRDEDVWLGYLIEFRDDMAQGEILDALKEHLIEIYHDLKGGEMPHLRNVGEIELS